MCQKCGCVMSERNLLEVMHAARTECQSNVNYTCWNVLLIVALEDTNEIVSVEGCFAADLGVNVFSTNISGLVSHIW